MILSGWGNHPRLACETRTPRDAAEVAEALRGHAGPLIARGNGRSYGDSALQPLGTLEMRKLDRLLAFDAETGILTAEAGVILADVIEIFLPKGWFPYVTPGTAYVTLGGMIAADVHGKNHHSEGSFGDHLAWLEVMGATGEVLRASPDERPDLFWATVGGMGLTGVILRAAFRLRRIESGWIRQDSIATRDLAETFAAFEAHHGATYSVAWIDCLASGADLGRAILTLGEHASVAELSTDAARAPYATPKRRVLSVPLNAPNMALNRHSVRAFNRLYYKKGCEAEGRRLVSWQSYFYPLDALRNWNRIYGARGFVQYQIVLPLPQAFEGMQALLARIAAAGLGSFLAVLKRMGPEGQGRLSFPMEGYTLALDFPASPEALGLLRHLDEITLAHGGRYYLAKDSRLTAATFARSDPRVAAFGAAIQSEGAPARFSSQQSERLGLT